MFSVTHHSSSRTDAFLFLKQIYISIWFFLSLGHLNNNPHPNHTNLLVTVFTIAQQPQFNQTSYRAYRYNTNFIFLLLHTEIFLSIKQTSWYLWYYSAWGHLVSRPQVSTSGAVSVGVYRTDGHLYSTLTCGFSLCQVTVELMKKQKWNPKVSLKQQWVGDLAWDRCTLDLYLS